jgi:polysaccharide biosynthesis protein PslH
MASRSGKKILVVSLNIPFPLIHGGAIAQYYFLKELSSIHEITLCTHARNKKDKNHLEKFATLLPKIKVIYSVEKKENVLFSKSVRQALKKWGQKLKKRKYDDLAELSLDNNNFLLPKDFVDFLQDHLAKNIYGAIQLEFYETLSLLPLLPSDVAKIYICHEIKSKRISNLKLHSDSRVYQNYVMNSIKVIEESFVKKADKIVVFTEEDKTRLLFDKLIPTISPFGIPDELIVRKNSSKDFSRFLFLGRESFWPNHEGLKWFLDEIFLPNEQYISWPVVILGEWTKEFKSVYKHPKIKFEGFVENVNEYYENSVLLSPILSGSGLKTKILLAFPNHVPVMSTFFGSEGLNDQIPGKEHILHFNNAKEFMTHFKHIEADPSILIQVAQNAAKFYELNFAADKLIEKRNRIY